MTHPGPRSSARRGAPTPREARATGPSRRPRRRRARRRGRPAPGRPAWRSRRARSAPRSRRAAHSSTSVAASRALETSSASSSSVSAASARARASRCTCPPERRTPRCPTTASGPPASSRSRSSRASSTARSKHAVVVEQDVVGEGAGEHARDLGDVGDLARAQEGLGVGDLDAVPADRAGVLDEAGQRREQAGLAGADLAQQQHQLAGARRSRSTPTTPRVPSSWTAATPRRLRRRSGVRGAAAGAGAVPATRSTPGAQVHQVAAAGQPARGLLPGPDAGRLGDDGAGDAAEPVEAVDGAGDEQRGGEVPAAEEVGGPRGDDAALHHHDRDAVEHGLHAVLEHRRLDAAAVDPRAGGGAPTGSRRRA